MAAGGTRPVDKQVSGPRVSGHVRAVEQARNEFGRNAPARSAMLVCVQPHRTTRQRGAVYVPADALEIGGKNSSPSDIYLLLRGRSPNFETELWQLQYSVAILNAR